MALLNIVKKRKVFDLYKFIDVYYYINSNFSKIDFDKLIKKIKVFHSEKYVYFTLKYLSEIFNDIDNKQVTLLIQKLEKENVKSEILNIIFNQYNKHEVFVSNTNIRDRIFEYNVINKYQKKENIWKN